MTLALFCRKVCRSKYRHAMIVAVMLVLTASIALAQTATPVPPTAVPPVSIEVPVDGMIENLNHWLSILAPIILFLGMIPVALGLLQYIVRMFRNAFGGGGD